MLYNYKEMLARAKREGYGVGLFNTTDMLEAAISAAEELRAPIILMVNSLDT